MGKRKLSYKKIRKYCKLNGGKKRIFQNVQDAAKAKIMEKHYSFKCLY